MNILLIPTGLWSEPDIQAALEKVGRVVLAIAPNQSTEQEVYLRTLLQTMEEERIDLVFSLQFYPVISLLCQTVQKKYIVWDCKAYDQALYSCALASDYNYLFLPDYSRYLEFRDVLEGRVFYLPMAANVERLLSTLTDAEEKTYDVGMIQDIRELEEWDRHPLREDCEFKDATKGYLEGAMACRWQLRGLPSLTMQLPAYVREDLFAHFPVQVAGDSVESIEHAYDARYFNPWATMLERRAYLCALAKNEHFVRSVLCSDGKAVMENKIEQRNKPENPLVLAKIINQCKINLVIPNRNWGSGINQLCWDVLGCGGFLFTPYIPDYEHCFTEIRPMWYENLIDMQSKAVRYLHRDEEREALSKQLQEIVKENHTYHHRIARIYEVMT